MLPYRLPLTLLTAAPSSCTQYHTGVSGSFQSYNYGVTSGLELSDMDYTICVRTERNFCGIQYTPCNDSGRTAGNMPLNIN